MKKANSILVTGGAGYVGSHVAAELVRRGYRVIVLDNLQTGHRAAVPDLARFIKMDLSDESKVSHVFVENRFDAIMHFAANTLPSESMQSPFLYLGNDVFNAVTLIKAAITNNVKRFVFSSTANLFSGSIRDAIPEDRAVLPGSPYGESKYIIERILWWTGEIHRMQSACLRYFNAAGADKHGDRGEDHRPEHHLIPSIMQVALGQRPYLEVFGDDYDTPDGTCIRDYVHVLDLAEAHILCLEKLKHGSCTYNIGSGKGYSVRAVIETARRITGASIPVVVRGRRPGDPSVLVADSRKIKEDLDWAPRNSSLQGIISSAWDWHRNHPKGYSSQ